MQEPQTWPEITAIASAVSQAQLQLVQNLLLLSKHFFCKTKCVHRVGRGPEGQRRLRAGGFPTLLQPCTESSPSSYSEVQQVPPGTALWEAGWGAGAHPTRPSQQHPPPKLLKAQSPNPPYHNDNQRTQSPGNTSGLR